MTGAHRWRRDGHQRCFDGFAARAQCPSTAGCVCSHRCQTSGSHPWACGLWESGKAAAPAGPEPWALTVGLRGQKHVLGPLRRSQSVQRVEGMLPLHNALGHGPGSRGR